jgi:hypothetical protein
MSFEAYIDTIRQKTGLEPADFKALAVEKGLVGTNVKAAQVTDWLAADYGLGRGHGMAIFAIIKAMVVPRGTPTERLDALFGGNRQPWRPLFDTLFAKAQGFGDDVSVLPTDTYASLLRGKRKFAVVAPAVGHFDIGIKRRDVPPEGRFEPAGNWNAMVSHRIRLAAGDSIDPEITTWLRAAYDAAV